MKIKQGDIVKLNFSPAVGNEMKGEHPALVVSSNSYNEKTAYIIVCPITSHGNNFTGYVPLAGYKVYGRVNCNQIHSFSLKRLVSPEIADKLRPEDFLLVKQNLDYALELEL